MPKIYPAQAPKINSVKILPDTYTHIGRLIRACAEIEDIIDLFVGGLLGINEAQTAILLGRTAITRRLEITEQLARLREDSAIEVFKACINSRFYDVLDCRNTVAHGVLLGETEGGKLAFKTTPMGAASPEGLHSKVVLVAPKQINTFASFAEGLVEMMEDGFQVKALREERLQQLLSPHPKSQDRGRAKQKPPPQSSEA